uniref:Uncharacterized protein n=1 Tax=Tanacetum cinerariifolium TaxID=118510 RepID=A0A6L2LMC6_TANCI|nr:hypothetical protein [Tanacetum cinerariifolium]
MSPWILHHIHGTLNYDLHLYSSTTSYLVTYSYDDWVGFPTLIVLPLGILLSLATIYYHGLLSDHILRLILVLHSSLHYATVVYCDNVSVYADIFTIGLASALFNEFRTRLIVQRSPAIIANACKWPPRVTLGRLLPHARGIGFKPRRGGFPSGAKNEWGLSPKAKVRVLHTSQLDVTVSVEGLPINAWENNTFSKVASMWGELVEWEDVEGNSSSYARVLKFFSDKIDDYSSDDESNDVDEGNNSRDKEFEKVIDDNDIYRVSESSCMRGDDFVHENITSIHSMETPYSNDPFNIYKLLNKKNDNVSHSKAGFEPIYPLGFTLEFGKKTILMKALFLLLIR